MIFIPVVPPINRQDDYKKRSLLLCGKTKKVVVKEMNYKIISSTIEYSFDFDSRLMNKIERLANGRKVIDYQLIPCHVDVYTVDRYLLIITCEKSRFD